MGSYTAFDAAAEVAAVDDEAVEEHNRTAVAGNTQVVEENTRVAVAAVVMKAGECSTDHTAQKLRQVVE